jgi:DNA ligase-associated metallophosphoesterase
MADSAYLLRIGGVDMIADRSGALFWPDEGTLIVADLHFEKASAFAAAGQLLPPYDTRATLAKLAAVRRRFAPRRIVCLGDSFHDPAGEARMDTADRAALIDLTAAVDWIWITGNHDPSPPDGLGGRAERELDMLSIVLRHEAVSGEDRPELSGHFHPKARIDAGPRWVSRPCFVEDGRRAILPAFGVLTGGLDVTDPAIAGLFPRGFAVHLLGRDSLHRFAFDAVA